MDIAVLSTEAECIEILTQTQGFKQSEEYTNIYRNKDGWARVCKTIHPPGLWVIEYTKEFPT